ncbi:MAG: retroviral-like aspartic protease family protein [Bacteroidetes bacterium]|nr:retroviral-like aspartic protease family protein [Bacteroidota bacterium]
MRTLNKLIIAAIATTLATGVFAQSSKVTSAWNYWRYKELDKAQKSIDEAVKHESTMNEAKTWHYRGKIYYDIAKGTKPIVKNSRPVVDLRPVIKMTKTGNVYEVPGKINGLELHFIFDTGASDVSISLTEALFMLKNHYITEGDFLEKESFKMANGDIVDGTKIIIKSLEIGSLKINNVEASVVHTLSAPILLGQSALERFGKFTVDYANSTLTFDDVKTTNSNTGNDLVYVDDSKSGFKNLSPDPLWEAAISFQKVLELDVKKKDFAPEALVFIDEIYRIQYNKGADEYQKKNYGEAVKYFERFLLLGDALGKYTGKPAVDTAVLFYTGNAANFNNDFAKAKEYYKKCYDLNYKEQALYLNYSELYTKDNDNVKAMEILDNGMKYATDKKAIAAQRLNMLVKLGKTDQAVDEGKKAIQIDPENISLYIALGTLYQSLKREKDAEGIYNQALVKEPDNFYVNHYAGLNYYNMGVGVFEQSEKLTDMKAITKKEDEAKEIWKKAIPLLEKAMKVKPEEKDSKKYLIELYARTGDVDKATKLKESK